MLLQALSWNDGADNSTSLKIIVLQQMFTLCEVISDRDFVKDLKNDIDEECSRFGTVDKVTFLIVNETIVITPPYRLPYFQIIQKELLLLNSPLTIKQKNALK